MIYLLLASNLLIAGALILVFILARRRLDAEKAALIEMLHAYFVPEKEGEQSAFGSFLDLATQNFASHICHTLRTQFMNINSIQSRQERAVAGAVVIDTLPPVLQVLATQFPSLAKIIRKNPELVANVAQSLAGFGKSNQVTQAGAPRGNGHHSVIDG